MLRDRSRSTSCSAFHDGGASSDASNNFSIHAEYRFSVARSHVLRSGQTLPGAALGGGGAVSRTAMSRVIVPQLAGALSRASVTCHVPAAGDATSANQKYGGPPCRSCDLAAMRPSGAINDSSPSSGCSAAKMTRKGAPFHGAIGDGMTASSAAFSQAPDGTWAWASMAEKSRPKSAPAASDEAVTAAANGCALWLGIGCPRAGTRNAANRNTWRKAPARARKSRSAAALQCLVFCTAEGRSTKKSAVARMSAHQKNGGSDEYRSSSVGVAGSCHWIPEYRAGPRGLSG